MNSKRIETKELKLGYGRRIVVEDVSFSVYSGDIVSLIGPNGSGKSTILAGIAGQLAAKGGDVCLCGRNLRDLKEKDIASLVALVLTKRIQPEFMSAWDVVATGRYPYTGRLGILEEKDRLAIDRALGVTNSLELALEPFESLSDGQKQRIMLARAICQETDIIVLDEPTTFLDLHYKLELLKIIRRLAKEEGKTIIMSMHELDMVRLISDRVVCVGENGILRTGTVEEVFEAGFMQRLFGIGADEFDPATGRVFLSPSDNAKGEAGEALKKESPAQISAALGEGVGALKEEVLPPSMPRDTLKSNRKKLPARVIMIQGTMSGAGKSLFAAALCRIFSQDGYRVAPFKAQNMSLNSYVTVEGLEIGRAQAMQAQAAGIHPLVNMNPILLKPMDNVGSQVIVRGAVHSNMKAMEYYRRKTEFIPLIKASFCELANNYDIIVIEGAGSPAEINLKDNDIVNMGMAEMVDSNVLLVADIDRGGVFAQLLGTLDLLEPGERNRVKGLIINKFRGDKNILSPGVMEIEKRGNIPVIGIIPYMDVRLEDEDSISERLNKRDKGILDIVVIKLPKLSNYTDFDPFEQIEGMSVRYVDEVRDLDEPDLIIIPGSKSTAADMGWLRERGLCEAIKNAAARKIPIIGICGGYQMLGTQISDPYKVETGESIEGLSLLPVSTVLEKAKRTVKFDGTLYCKEGLFNNTEGSRAKGGNLEDSGIEGSREEGNGTEGSRVEGYEIHMGKTVPEPDQEGLLEFTSGKTGYYKGNVYGTYVHGLFDNKEILCSLVAALGEKKGIHIDTSSVTDYKLFKEGEYDRLAAYVREHMDMKALYGALNQASIEC